ncbi:MAG: hypothetical protein AB7N76_34465 [Planctomycetota bacterium]
MSAASTAAELRRLLAVEFERPGTRARLERLAPFVLVELEDEEGPGGLLEEVLDVEPGLERRARRLRRAHRRIRGSLQRLLELLDLHPARDRAVQLERRRLTRLLDENHHTEARLLQEALYRENGGEG